MVFLTLTTPALEAVLMPMSSLVGQILEVSTDRLSTGLTPVIHEICSKMLNSERSQTQKNDST